jgi:hypothetical protein
MLCIGVFFHILLLTQKTINELLFPFFFKENSFSFLNKHNKIIIHQSVDPKMHKREKANKMETAQGLFVPLWHDSNKRDVFLQRRR